jgi:hypothetical protein
MKTFSIKTIASLVLLLCSSTLSAALCDIDNDNDVDRIDIRHIFSARGQVATGSDDPRDQNQDGTISIADGRACQHICTLAYCAEPVINNPPIANAGDDQEVFVNSQVILDGSASNDAEGQTLSYQWVLLSKPTGSAAVLTLADSAQPELIVDIVGQYDIALTVNDGINNSVADNTLVLANALAVTRVLNDSPVNGVSYRCDGNTGITQNGGEFTCLNTPVVFSIGNLTIGTISNFDSDNQVFPQDFAGVNRDDFSDEKTIKIARLLQSLDDDGDISQTIDIPILISQKFQQQENIDDKTLAELAAIAGVDLVTQAYAISHLRRSLLGGEDRDDYVVRINLSDAVAGKQLTTDVRLTIKGAEVLDVEKNALNKLTLNGFLKSTTLFLKNIPEANQDIKIITQAEGYLDSGASITLFPSIKHYDLNLNLVKDKAGVVANGVFASKTPVSNKVNTSGEVTELIVVNNKEAINKPGVKVTIPAGTQLSDKNGTPIVGAKLNITSFDPYQSDAMAAYPGGLNVMADASGFIIDGVPQVGDTEINFKSAGFAAISIVDAQGNKVKNFSNDIEIAMQFAIGTTDGEGKTVVIGDQVPIWSYDEDVGKWSYEKMGLVQDLDFSDGLFDVTYSINHLTYWNLDWILSACRESSRFTLSNSTHQPHEVRNFRFEVSLLTSPIIDWWFINTTDDSDFVQFLNPAAGLAGKVEVWTLDRRLKLASQSFTDLCGPDYDLVFEYDDEYKYEAAIAIIEALNNVVDKSGGVRLIVEDSAFILSVAELLAGNDELERSNELFQKARELILLYSAAFIEKEGYVSVTPNIYGCDDNLLNFVEELLENFYYQDIYAGPFAGMGIAGALPYIVSAANGFIAHNPDQLAYAPYGIRGFVECGYKIAAELAALGDESNLQSFIVEHFEPVILSNLTSIRSEIEIELAVNGFVSLSSGATFEYIVTEARVIANELAASGNFSTVGINTIDSALAYYNELVSTGKINDFTD